MGRMPSWNMSFVFETWWWPLTIEGFGGWKFDLSFRSKDLRVIEIRNSAVAQSMGLAGKPVCHLYAGLFAGALSFYDKQERECIEIQCYAMGNNVCKLMVGDKKRVNAAEFWRKEGATAVDILGHFEG